MDYKMEPTRAGEPGGYMSWTQVPVARTLGDTVRITQGAALRPASKQALGRTASSMRKDWGKISPNGSEK